MTTMRMINMLQFDPEKMRDVLEYRVDQSFSLPNGLGWFLVAITTEETSTTETFTAFVGDRYIDQKIVLPRKTPTFIYGRTKPYIFENLENEIKSLQEINNARDKDIKILKESIEKISKEKTELEKLFTAQKAAFETRCKESFTLATLIEKYEKDFEKLQLALGENRMDDILTNLD
jgi:hypothetical protein